MRMSQTATPPATASSSRCGNHRRYTLEGYGTTGRSVVMAHGYITDKDAYLKRLRRIEGQIRGLQRMVDQENYCIDILTQVSAATKALESVALGLLDDHLAHCVVDAARAGGPDADVKLKEASEAIARLVRS
jgi:CsoR family transcriptional regulator, copper-sensing transcriptional repressor